MTQCQPKTLQGSVYSITCLKIVGNVIARGCSAHISSSSVHREASLVGVGDMEGPILIQRGATNASSIISELWVYVAHLTISKAVDSEHVFVCVCVCVCVCLEKKRKEGWICACMCVCICVCKNVCMQEWHLHVCNVCVCVCVHVYMCICVFSAYKYRKSHHHNVT